MDVSLFVLVSLLVCVLYVRLRDRSQVIDAVNKIVVQDLPTRSTDLPKGSSVYNDFITCVDKLLKALEETASLPLLKILFAILRERVRTSFCFCPPP
jgi:hypothetical protein